MNSNTTGTADTELTSNPEKTDNSHAISEQEPASIVYGSDGAPRGAAIFLTAADLRALGLSLGDVEAVVPRVYKGALLVDPIN